MNIQQHVNEKFEILRAASIVAATTIGSLSLEQWLTIASIVYVVLQIGLLLMKYFKIYKDREEAKKQKKRRSTDA